MKFLVDELPCYPGDCPCMTDDCGFEFCNLSYQAIPYSVDERIPDWCPLIDVKEKEK